MNPLHMLIRTLRTWQGSDHHEEASQALALVALPLLCPLEIEVP